MKLAKSLLLASAAGFAAFGAQAADLPSKKAAPVEYVKVCKTYGAGFFTIPGTETCVRFGGQLRSDVNWDERFSAASNKSTLAYRARITMDARTQTEIGLVRTFTQVAFTNGTLATNNNQVAILGGSTNDNYAFIQAGGFTGGLADSFFGYIPGTMVVGAPGRDAPQLGVFAYTIGNAKANFTLALQEPRGYTAQTQGSPHPDVVGRANFVSGNMGAYLSAALHANPSMNATATDTDYGYAVGLGVFATNFAGAGSRVDVAGYYADGATAYLTNGTISANTFGSNAEVAVRDRDPAGRSNTAWAVNGVATVPVAKGLNAVATAGHLSVNDRTGTSDYTRTYVGIGAQYTVVSGLSVRPEVGYTWFNREGAAIGGQAALARLRVQRDF